MSTPKVLVEHDGGLAINKRTTMEQPDWPLTEMSGRQEPIPNPVPTSNDARQGTAAFAEKQPSR